MSKLKRDPRNVSKRAHRVLEIAARMAEAIDKQRGDGYSTRNRIEEIQLHFEGYAEPGYSAEHDIIATGNWNTLDRYDPKTHERTIITNLPSRLFDIFEALGIEGEWSDEWSACGECYRLVRTQSDSYSWQPSYHIGEGEILCDECCTEDPEDYLESCEGEMSCVLRKIDPAEHGYVKVNEDPYESGWHPGQTDDPRKVAADLRAKGIDRFVFRKDEQSQFYSKWSVYVHTDQADKLK